MEDVMTKHVHVIDRRKSGWSAFSGPKVERPGEHGEGIYLTVKRMWSSEVFITATWIIDGETYQTHRVAPVNRWKNPAIDAIHEVTEIVKLYRNRTAAQA